MSLQKQFDEAKKHVKQMKKVSPYIFHEYNRLHTAKRNLEAAKKEYEAAKLAWKNL